MGMSLFVLVWLFVDKSTVSFILILITITARSIFHHGNGIAQTRHMLNAVPSDKQGMMVVINTLVNMSVAISPLLGGVFLMLTENTNFNIASHNVNNYHLLFALSCLLMVIPHIIRKGFREEADTPTSDVLLLLRRPSLRLGYFVRTGPGKETSRKKTSQ